MTNDEDVARGLAQGWMREIWGDNECSASLESQDNLVERIAATLAKVRLEEARWWQDRTVWMRIRENFDTPEERHRIAALEARLGKEGEK
jgi:hypothetical protein